MAQLGVGGDERLEPEGPERAAVVGHDRDRRDEVRVGVDLARGDQWPAEGGLVVGQGELDRSDRVVLVRGRGRVPGVFVLRPVVPAPGQAPGLAGGGLELGEVQLPDLIRAGGLGRERGLAAGGQLAAFALVVRLQDQALITQQAQDAGLGDGVPVVAAHRPDLAMTPRRVGQRVPARRVADALPGRARPRALDPGPGPGTGLMAAPGPLGHADQLTEPRGRHARLGTDHLEVLEGPRRPSALFFHTRISTAASPRAWVRSTTSASSWASRVDGPDFPATRPVLPASRNCRFQFPTDCSETFA